MKKYSKEDQRIMAAWAAGCAERVLPFFEKAYPNDDRPRHAIEACRSWVSTGVFKMAIIRGASLAAHAAAREAKAAACFAARAAGHAVATAHVAQHAYGSAYYALKAVAAAHAGEVAKERAWQSRHLPRHLRHIMNRIRVEHKGEKMSIKILKDEGF